jgi:hypothetical protein
VVLPCLQEPRGQASWIMMSSLRVDFRQVVEVSEATTAAVRSGALLRLAQTIVV